MAGDVDELYASGFAAYNAGNYKTAIEQLQKVVDRQPNNWRAKLYLSVSHFKSGDVLLANFGLRAICNNCPDPEIKQLAQTTAQTLQMMKMESQLEITATKQLRTFAVMQQELASTEAKPSVNGKISRLVNVKTGKAHQLNSERTCIGRDPSNQIVIPDDKYVSRVQAVIVVRNGEYWLEEVMSINPTRVNGEPINPRKRLKYADVIKLGQTSFKVQ
jgi:hypothetical protein